MEATASSERLRAVSTLAATRPANVVPRQVKTGRPTRSASQALLCALYGRVSRKRSASPTRGRLVSKILDRRLVRSGQPQHAFLDIPQQLHPDVKQSRRILEAVVERG